ncbi:hypothetical protein AZI86_01710 [Bdellovibrio bacteriovorus]|uniref:Uncharacterized protein n=1 Tax=Bdellovibrio bacteriovorus TaxID=959 RepID=A0A150WNN9_BDEBC|nr:hypothetical protein [Bdellovibrio bacteriovorus]KYG65815.1 hypothetical protein AZI86_01710 [Bdellovibrio bacteriovorus]
MSSDLRFKVVDLEASVMVLEEENRLLRGVNLPALRNAQVAMNFERQKKIEAYVFRLVQENLELRKEMSELRKEKNDLYKVVHSLSVQLRETQKNWDSIRNYVGQFKKDMFKWFYLKESAPHKNSSESSMHGILIKKFLDDVHLE